MTNIEIEFKNLLTKTQYENLVNFFNLQGQNYKYQLNIYFDTLNNDLYKKNIALRVRIVNNQRELTLKEQAFKKIIETTDYLTKNELDKLINKHIINRGNVYQKLLSLNINESLYEIARLKTYRYEFPYLNNIIALDKSIYYNHVDYEIELETQDYDYGKKVFEELLKTFHIKKQAPKNKIIRAYEYKKSLNNQRF